MWPKSKVHLNIKISETNFWKQYPVKMLTQRTIAIYFSPFSADDLSPYFVKVHYCYYTSVERGSQDMFGNSASVSGLVLGDTQCQVIGDRNDFYFCLGCFSTSWNQRLVNSFTTVFETLSYPKVNKHISKFMALIPNKSRLINLVAQLCINVSLLDKTASSTQYFKWHKASEF